jgi:hypothetical protein
MAKLSRYSWLYIAVQKKGLLGFLAHVCIVALDKSQGYTQLLHKRKKSWAVLEATSQGHDMFPLLLNTQAAGVTLVAPTPLPFPASFLSGAV